MITLGNLCHDTAHGSQRFQFSYRTPLFLKSDAHVLNVHTTGTNVDM